MIWQLPDDRMGVRTAPILLLSRDDVARDIGLTSDQRQKTWEKIADLGRRAADLKGRNDKEVNVLRRSIDQSQLDWLRTELKPVQLARLTQIDLQWEGPSAILSRVAFEQAQCSLRDFHNGELFLKKSFSSGPRGADRLEFRPLSGLYF